MYWLDNAWVVGIGTGVLSGIVVTWMAQWILSRKENRDYRKNVVEANREIVYTIRSGIPEEQIPSREIILALTNSTARRYGVSAADLYAPREIAEELIKEVMDSSFLPAGKKTEYGQLLLPIGVEQTAGVPYPEGVLHEREVYIGYRRQTFLSIISASLGMLAAAATTLFYLVSEQKAKVFELFTSHRIILFIVLSTATLLFVMEILASGFFDLRPWRKNRGADGS